MDVIDVIAETGFGRVELVRLDDGSFAARKVLAPRPDMLVGVTAEQLRRRFGREVRIQRELPHRFVIPILEADLEADPPWFVMPLADANLEDRKAALRADHDELRNALEHVLDALDRLHALGYAHRDLKPSNVLLHDGRWKLADLGLVLPVTSESTKLTMSRQGWGSLAYCAPEQFLDFRTAGQAADIFAIGCILHDFYGVGDRAPCQRVSAPGPVGTVIEKSTEVDPAKRFKCIDRLRAALFDVLAKPPAPPDESESSSQAAVWASKLADVKAMASTEVASLARFLRCVETRSEAWAVFTSLTEECLVALKERDPDAWAEIAAQYCEWAKGDHFDFQYCDVIVRRLLVIYELGSVEMKSNAALAAAKLGDSHNRWYVMDRVLVMCGREIDNNVAQRIAIEIRAGELEKQFARCATEIEEEVSVYHPLISAMLPDEEQLKAEPASNDDDDDDIPF